MGTTHGANRRALRFQSIDAAVAEADALVALAGEQRLDHAGNWQLGQTLGHLATWANFAHDGYPPEIRPPLPLRFVLRLARNRMLSRGMPAGVRIGRVPGGTLGMEPLEPQEGLRRFRAAMDRLRREAPSLPNPIFGRLTHEQWIQLNLRHAELHLGFQLPRQ